MNIVIEMDQPVTRSTKVYYEILNTGTATAGTDYTQPANDFVQFVRNTYLPTNPLHATFTGDRQQIIRIDTIEDTGDTSNKTIDLRLTRTEGSAVIGVSNITTTATIIDTGAVPTLTITPKSAVAEDAGPAMFTITAVGGSVDGKMLKVRYTPAEVGSGNFLTSSAQVSQNLTFTANPQGEFKQDISIVLDDDNVGETTGQIEVVLNDPASTTSVDQFYQVGSQNSARVTIWDDDAPELSIADIRGITEGSTTVVIFPITAKASPNKLLKLRYSISQPGSGYDFVSSTGTATRELDFTSNRKTANLQIGITNDFRDENNGIVRVTLLPDLTIDEDGNPKSIEYIVSSIAGENIGEVMVTDNDPAPELTLSALGATSESLGAVSFVVSSTVDLGLAFKVRYQASEVSSGNFLSDGSGSPPTENQEDIATQSIDFSQSGSNYAATLFVPIHDDNVTEATGRIQVELLAGDNTTDSYVVATGNEEEEVAKRIQRVTIYDDDAPELTIAGGDPVTEADGAMATFTVSAKVSPNDRITVYYTVSDDAGDADFLALSAEGPKYTTLDFSSGKLEANFMIAIENDMMVEDNGSISVELTADQTTPEIKYMVGSPATGTVNIIDDDSSLPVISMETLHPFISPGLPLTFTVSIEPRNETPITVPITARDATNSSLVFRTSPLIVGTEGTVTTMVATQLTSTGDLTVTLGNVAGHISGPPLVVPIETPPIPAILTISGPSRPVREGNLATFTITANPTIDRDIIVEVDVIDFAAKGTDFVDDGNHFVRLPANATRTTFNVQTKTDTSESTDGVLVATMLDGSGYMYSSPNNIGYAEVRDAENTTPAELTVSTDITKAYQEEDIVFTITRTGDTTNALDFKYDLADDEDFIDGEGMAIDGRINANATSTQITLPTKEVTTSYTEPAGVTLRLNSVLDDPDLEYRLGSSTELTVEVGSSAKPVITLSIEPNYIARGNTFYLVATATPAPIRTTSVIVNLTSEPQTYPINNRYLLEAFRGEQTIEIAANAMRGQIPITSTPVDLNPADGEVEDSDAIINATLQADSNYSLPSEPTGRTEKVGVLGTLPEVSISTRNSSVQEDVGSIEVTIYTKFLPFVGLPLKITSLTATNTGSVNYLADTVDFSNLEIGNTDEVFIHDRFRGIRTTVPIRSYPDYQGPGEITITLADANNYTANSEASTQKVIIQDAQPYPDRTISIDVPDRVFEGEDIVVTLTSSAALLTNETIDVGFAVASIPVEYYNATDSTSSPVQFTSASLTQTVTIKTVDVADHATDGTIYIQLLRGNKYEPVSTVAHEVTIVAKEDQTSRFNYQKYFRYNLRRR